MNVFRFLVVAAITAVAAFGPGANAAAAQPAKSAFRESDRIVFTYYFMWYDAPNDYHISTPKGTDSLTLHPAPYTKSFDKNPDYKKRAKADLTGGTPFSFRNPAMHEQELARMTGANIDICAVDFWAFADGIAPHSRVGAENLNKALNALDRANADYPAVCLFLETKPLGQPGGLTTDLTTVGGGTNLFAAVDAFYSRIDRKHWATIDKRAVVILYESGIPNLTIGVRGIRACREQFLKKYGVELAFVGNNAWEAQAPNQIQYTCAWNACGREDRLIEGPNLMQVSPGYNYQGDIRSGKVDTPPNPAAYKAGWERARKQPRNWIAVETWNEWHESTGVAPTVEGGTQLEKITREQAALFKKRK